MKYGETLAGADVKFSAIHLNSAPEALAEQIMGRIGAGKLKPGQILPSQRELARMFQVGLGTVREAVKILCAMGCVKVLRGKGTFVAQDPLSVKIEAPAIENVLESVSLAELMKAREVVECGAARMAAEKADREGLIALRKTKSRMLSGCSSPEINYENDFRFHIAVAEAADNRVILEIVRLLVDQAHKSIKFMNNSLGVRLPPAVANCAGSAVQVVDFILKGDPGCAGDAMLKHLNTVTTENFLKSSLESGCSARGGPKCSSSVNKSG